MAVEFTVDDRGEVELPVVSDVKLVADVAFEYLFAEALVSEERKDDDTKLLGGIAVEFATAFETESVLDVVAFPLVLAIEAREVTEVEFVTDAVLGLKLADEAETLELLLVATFEEGFEFVVTELKVVLFTDGEAFGLEG